MGGLSSAFSAGLLVSWLSSGFRALGSGFRVQGLGLNI